MDKPPYTITPHILKFVADIQVIPIESLIHFNQKKYYRALEKSDTQGESTEFIEFSLEMILNSLKEFLGGLSSTRPKNSDRIEVAQDHFKTQYFSRKDYMNLHKDISSATASRDLALAVKEGRLKIKGSKAQAHYVFKS